MNITKSKQIKFLFISYSDLYSGASIAGYSLHKAILDAGYISTMVVNRKLTDDNTVIELNGFIKRLYQDCISGGINFPFSYRFGILLKYLYNYFYKLLKLSGREIFYYPASKKILQKISYHPTLIHLHDIHSDYFDISILHKWSKNSILFFTLHDLWLFTGHCGLPLDCDRYKIGCGSCPDLSLPPSIPRDRTKKNFFYKSNILKNIPINFIAPSQWVYNQIQNIEINFKSKIEIITNTVDTNNFIPGDKKKIRLELKLPIDSTILLTCSMGFKHNPYKDIDTLLMAFNKIEEEYKCNDKNILLVILGEKGDNYNLQNNDNIIFTNQIFNKNILLNYYQSADLYINSSHIETWGLTISEALSTGLPVIATAVGGVPEQLKGYKYNLNNDLNKFDIEQANGVLFERENINSLYDIMKWALDNRNEREILAKNARAFAVNKLSMGNQLPNYLKYYLNTLSG